MTIYLYNDYILIYLYNYIIYIYIIIIISYNYCGEIHHRTYIIVNIYIHQTFLLFTCLQVKRDWLHRSLLLQKLLSSCCEMCRQILAVNKSPLSIYAIFRKELLAAVYCASRDSLAPP